MLEFFWYGCIHCYNLEPKLETWLKTLPKDVEFRRVPAVFNDRWAHDAAIFYAFEALGLLDKLHRPFFDAIHRDRLRTDNWHNLSAWLEKQGVDVKKFESTIKSFGVQSKTKRAIRLTSGYKIDGTPAMAVHGRYGAFERGHARHRQPAGRAGAQAKVRKAARDHVRIVITGASSGIGEALARHYARDGAALAHISPQGRSSSR